MPCYDGRDKQRTETVYRSGISPSDMQKVIDKNEWLEAAVCALMKELGKRNISGGVVAEASRKWVDRFDGFLGAHQKSDESRIAKALHSFSKDEQAIIKKLLNT